MMIYQTLQIIGFLLLPTTFLFAEGYYLHEKNSLAMVDHKDASVIFYNPAGLIELPSLFQGIVSTSTYFVKAPFENKNSKDKNGGTPKGLSAAKSNLTTHVPSLFLAYKPHSRWAMGLGLFTPFGLGVKYQPSWIGRYEVIEADLKTINLNPSFGYGVNDKISVGMGLNIQHFECETKKAVDFSSIAGAAPQTDDGLVSFHGQSVSYGYNVGGLYKPTTTSSLGIAWRSPITHDINHGKITFERSATGQVLAANTGFFKDSQVRARMKFPGSLLLYAHYDVTRQWSLTSEIMWMNWSRNKETRIKFLETSQSDDVTRNEYKNTWRVSFLGRYKPYEKIDLFAGVGYAETPTRDYFRQPSLPDTDRLGIWGGLTYQILKNLLISASLRHFKYKQADISLISPVHGSLKGTSKPSVDMMTLHLNWIF